MRSRARSERAGDGGQSAVELALCVPLVCIMLLGVVQVAVVVRDALAVQLAAREGARAAAVSSAPGASAAMAARAAVPIDPLAVHTVASRGSVTVTVTYVSPTDVPLLGLLVPAVVLTSSVTMRVEPP